MNFLGHEIRRRFILRFLYLTRGDLISFIEFYFDDLEESELAYLNNTKDINIYEKLLCQDAQYRILEKRQRQRIKLLSSAQGDDTGKSVIEAEKQLADILAKHDRVLVQIAKLEGGDVCQEDFEINIGSDSYEA